MPISVEVSNSNVDRCHTGSIASRQLESAFAVAEKDRYRTVPGTSRLYQRQIQIAVLIEVADRDPDRVGCRKGPRRLKCSITVAQKNHNSVDNPVGEGKVEVATLSEMPCYYSIRQLASTV